MKYTNEFYTVTEIVALLKKRYKFSRLERGTIYVWLRAGHLTAKRTDGAFLVKDDAKLAALAEGKKAWDDGKRGNKTRLETMPKRYKDALKEEYGIDL